MKNIFLTGATGFLGSYFLYHQLQHTNDHVICLARNNSKYGAHERVMHALRVIHESFAKAGIENKHFKENLLKNVEVIPGDITQHGLGMAQILKAGDIDECWHIAANVKFLESMQNEIIVTNLEGGKNILQFAEKLRIPVFNYISTAYVAGKNNGIAKENIDFEKFPPNNVYEQSKRLMELEIVKSHQKGNLNYRIFRPSVIVGHSITAIPDPSNGGFYGFLSILKSFKIAYENNYPEYFTNHPLKFHCNGNNTLNIVPVDYVTRMMHQISEEKNSLNKIFHITSDVANTLRDFAFYTNFYSGINILLVQSCIDFNQADLIFSRKINRYAGYLMNNLKFEKKSILLSGLKAEKCAASQEKIHALIQAFYKKQQHLQPSNEINQS